jgi:thiol-disulfide isomerase/thioredoxin
MHLGLRHSLAPRVFALLLALGCLGYVRGNADPATTADDPDSGVELLGTPAPAWEFTRWVRGHRATVASLRGKVVLLRWWTTGCHFCETTLPVIETLRVAHEKQGLVVIGVFHPKPPRDESNRSIVAAAGKRGFHGPLAFDRDWTTLGHYWLDGHDERSWTSVSFLIGRDGTIRWVHGGGEYHPNDDPRHQRCDVQFHELERALSAALAEPAPAPPAP